MSRFQFIGHIIDNDESDMEDSNDDDIINNNENDDGNDYLDLMEQTDDNANDPGKFTRLTLNVTLYKVYLLFLL